MDKPYAIFDMDGTLIDSMVFWKGLAEEYLHSKGIPDIPEDLPDRIQSMTMTESGELFRQAFGLTGDIPAEMNAMMNAHYHRDIPLKTGAADYLSRLRARGVRMCVASATAEPLMESCLKRLGVRDHFDFLLSCESVGAGKNRPDVYFEAAKRLGARPADCAVYEDALYAVKTARAAGFSVIAVYDPSADWEKAAKIADETILNWEDTL